MENNEAYALPDLSSAPIEDSELVEKHLRPSHERYVSERINGRQAEVNSGLPLMNPWELIPAATRQEERRETYFLTTNNLRTRSSLLPKPSRRVLVPDFKAFEGSWKPRGLGWAIAHKNGLFCPAGHKVTYDLYTEKDIKTNWIMNVYSLIDQEGSIQGEMVLCHVFENNSPHYDPRPECARFREALAPVIESTCAAVLGLALSKRSCGSCSYEHSGKPCNEAIHGPSSSSLRGTAPGSLSTHHASDRPSSDARLTSYIAQLKKVVLGDDPEISADAGNYDSRGDENGRSGKRPKTAKSDVWQRFTKIYAHGPDGVPVTLAACNHCCKVLTGDSKKHGTSHLKRHTCPCKH